MTDGPTEPQPSGPIEPSDLIEPSDPSESRQPSESGRPSESNGPSESDQPSDSGQSSEPPPTGSEDSEGPPPNPDTYRVGNVVGLAVLAFLLLWPLMLWAQFIAVGGFPVASVVAGIAVGILPIVWAAVKFRRAANKSAASPWLGLLIGSALFLVIFSGSCVTLLLTVPL